MNDYSYIDPDRTYTDPETGILRNKLNIKDQNALMFAEAAATAKRTSELRARPIRIKDARYPLSTLKLGEANFTIMHTRYHLKTEK